MKVPVSWLKEYVNLDGIPVSDLAEQLTVAGLEVASIEYSGVAGPAEATHLVWDPETIRVAEIVAVAAHPNADRLRLVTVRFGDGEPKTVVTGAPNVRPGQRVAYAMSGATVINGYSEAREHVRLEPKKLRGILSEGMVLSERELGLSDTHEGILELPEDAPVGQPLQSYLGDVVLEVELTPNIVGHAASIVGVAREVAALFDRPLHKPPTTVQESGASTAGAVRIEIQVPELNPRFTARLIRDVQIGPSPWWMQRRLLLCGMRPINNVVDVTNYVMLELGQPLHAFDYERLVERAARVGDEIPTLIMRRAHAGETLKTLDERERHLQPDDVLVTDTAGIISLAGIMGGAETEVSAETRTVLLEAAAWNFISIRRSATHHGLFSEAAYRFSRNVHPAMALRANNRAASLLAQVAGGAVATGIVDAYPLPAEPLRLPLEAGRVNHLLGTNLAAQEIAELLGRLEFEVEREGDSLQVTVPDYRTDISLAADLVEEVGRIYGLSNLPLTLLADALPPLRVDVAREVEERVRDLLVASGLTETVSYSMTAPEREALLLPDPDAARDASESGYVCLLNPISQERRVMRRTLLASVIETAGHNLRHHQRIALFEIGSVYLPEEGQPLPREQRRLAIALTGPAEPASWHPVEPRPLDFFDLKGIVEALLAHLHLSEEARFQPTDHPTFQPGRAATLLVHGQPIGTLGELHPRVRQANELPAQRVAAADLDLAALVAAAPASATVQAVPRFPAVMQDLAAVVDEAVSAAQVASVIRAAGGALLQQIQLFDVYRGKPIPEGKKSLAYALRYLHAERSMTDEEVAGYHAAITAALRQQLGAQIRGEDEQGAG